MELERNGQAGHAVADIPQEAFDWYDEYAHGLIDRRTFLSRIASLAGAGISASLVLGALLPDYARAEQVSFNDPAIRARYHTFASPEGYGEGRGYLVAPTATGTPLPAVLVVHENRGLNPYVKDVARRLAKAGYLAFAPDALHPLGGYPGNDDEGRAMQRSLERERIEADFVAAARFLKQHERSNGRLGAVGFCFGGYMVNYLAARVPELLDAGVPFYGTPAAQSLWPRVRGPLLLHFAGNDERVNATWPEYRKALEEQGVEFTAQVYPGVNHGFHNDSTARYSEAEAELAWRRTLEFFHTRLAS
jgi:carboxymethylenebutenolidase